MQVGVHVIERDRLSAIGTEVAIEKPWMGVIDLVRMIDGRLGEPTPHAPLGVIGVDALLRAATERPDELLRRIRTTLHGGKEYFQWKQIPVVFLVRGSLDYSPNDGLSLRHEDEEWSLSPLLGKNFTAAKPGTMGWWWTPQFG